MHVPACLPVPAVVWAANRNTIETTANTNQPTRVTQGKICLW